MFTSNPWADYTILLAALLIAYYLFVVFKFYGSDLRAWIAPRSSSPAVGGSQLSHQADWPEAASSIPSGSQLDHFPQEASLKETFSEHLEELSGHLKDIIQEANQKQYSQEDLIMLLQMTLREYPTISGSPFQRMINNLIDLECAKYGSLHLQAQDKVMIWKSV